MQAPYIILILSLAVAGCVSLAARQAAAQPADAPDAAPGWVTLNFPDEVELKVLIDYVGKRQGVNFIYDEQIAGKKVTIKAAQNIPAESLMTLMESAMKMKGLVLSPTAIPGTMRIEPARQLTATSAGPGAVPGGAEKGRPTLAVTRVFDVKHASPQRVEQVLTPFLSGTTANLVSLADLKMVIVTDFADNMKKIEDLMSLVDRPGRQVAVRFVAVTHMEASAISQTVTQLLAGRSAAQGAANAAALGAAAVVPDDRTNQIAVFGGPTELDEVAALIKSLDVPLNLATKVYSLSIASPEQIDRIIKRLIGDVAAKRLYKSAAEREAGLLVATTTPEIHAQIEALRQALDKPREESQSPVRFYKLENAKAADILSTLESIEGDTGLGDVSVDGVSSAEPKDAAEPKLAIKGPTEEDVNNPLLSGYGATRTGEAAPTRKGGVKLRDARVVADDATNTVIVVARPAAQVVYEKLIKRLDVRRPQVLVEATIVALDTTDGFSLGVEIYSKEKVNGGDLLNFTQFGLTADDSLPGSVTLSPGIGFTGALLNADIAEVVIKALKKDSRVKVMSRPSVLINDNAQGSLLSEAEEPFASVNASNTVATTSFAGFASAGTNIKVTPQISEGDYLKLKYEVTLSSFGDDGSESLPPSRQKNTLASEATIPDGHTIVVGGLTRETLMENSNRIPILGEIPGLEYLFSSREKSGMKTTLFVFIRAVVLRDDKFKDLKVVSDAAAGRIGLESAFPASEPLLIE